MVSSKAETVEAYLNELPSERRAIVERVREMVLENLPEGYAESMNWGMISFEVPLETYPETYNGKPLSYVALAAQKHHYALYLNGVYMDPEQQKLLKKGFDEAGKKMDMGKSCLRFKRLDDLPLDVVGEIIAATSVDDLITGYESVKRK